MLAIPLTYGFDAVRGLLLNTVTLLPIRYEIAILLLFMAMMLPSAMLFSAGSKGAVNGWARSACTSFD
ncbi:MAG: hypothetical protein M3Q45_09270 [Chloroflexota bacterium]|nr:hypothetical protein [Chloroflexota bacterium]